MWTLQSPALQGQRRQGEEVKTANTIKKRFRVTIKSLDELNNQVNITATSGIGSDPTLDEGLRFKIELADEVNYPIGGVVNVELGPEGETIITPVTANA